MQFCDVCGNEFGYGNGDNTCRSCEDRADTLGGTKAREAKARLRKAREAALRSCGLVKVRGALGGIYWE